MSCFFFSRALTTKVTLRLAQVPVASWLRTRELNAKVSPTSIIASLPPFALAMSSPRPASPAPSLPVEDDEELSFNPMGLFGAPPAVPTAPPNVADIASHPPSSKHDQPEATPTHAVESDVEMADQVVEEEDKGALVMNGLLGGGGGVSRAQEKPSSPPQSGDLNASRQGDRSKGTADVTSTSPRATSLVDEADAEDDGFTMNGILGGGDQSNLPSSSSSSSRPPPPRPSAAANLTGLHLRDGLTSSSNFATTSTDQGQSLNPGRVADDLPRELTAPHLLCCRT